MDVTFEDSPQGCWGFFCTLDFFLWICKSHCIKYIFAPWIVELTSNLTYMIVPLLDNLHSVFLRDCGSPGPSGCAYTAEAAHEARFSSSLHYLPARASSRPAQG